LRAQKKEQEKGTLFHGPSGYFVLLAFFGTLKNSASPQTVLTSISSKYCDAQRERMGFKK
jgi:hypothetical protein